MFTPIPMYSTRLVTLWDLMLVKLDFEDLKRSPIFAGFRWWEIRKVVLLGALEEHGDGEYILRRGERGTEMYMVVQGRVRISEDAGPEAAPVTATLGPGMVFGEVGALSGRPRLADVIADGPATVLRLDWTALERVRRRFPFTGAKLFRNVGHIMAHRLRGGRQAGALTGPVL
jgi:CRP-like cAMP-binding protein